MSAADATTTDDDIRSRAEAAVYRNLREAGVDHRSARDGAAIARRAAHAASATHTDQEEREYADAIGAYVWDAAKGASRFVVAVALSSAVETYRASHGARS